MYLDSVHAVALNHKHLPISRIEKAFFRDIDAALKRLMYVEGVEGVAIIQTCNRVEVYCDLACGSDVDHLVRAWEDMAGDPDIGKDAVRISGLKVFEHLARLASGLESMVIGEQEILRQVKEAYFKALSAGSLSRLLKFMMEEAIRIGKRVRSETEMGRRRVSLAHLAVRSVERILEDMNDKVILIVGAGETGELVNLALTEKQYRKLTLLFANRTYERAVRLADISGGIALRMDQIDRYLKVADVVFVTTSAPHYIITRKKVEEAVRERDKPLMIVDLSVPRNVEPSVAELPNTKLLSIDDLREYLGDEASEGIREVSRVESIIEEEVKGFQEKLEKMWISELVSEMYQYAERVRIEELEEAFSIMGRLDDEKTKKILDNMSKAIVKRLLNPLVENLKRNYKCVDKEGLRKLFSVYSLGPEWAATGHTAGGEAVRRGEREAGPTE